MAEFIFGEGGERLTPDAVKRRRALAEQLMATGTQFGPVGSIGEGAARVAAALAGGLINLRNDQLEGEAREEASQKFQGLLAASRPGAEMQGPNTDGTTLPPVPKTDFTSLAQVASDPFLPDTARPVVAAMLERQMQAPQRERPLVIEGKMVSPTGEIIADFSQPKPQPVRTRIVGAEEVQEEFNPTTGQWAEIGRGRRWAPQMQPQPQTPSEIREYEFARSQGFPGTYLDFQQAKRPGTSLSVDPATGQVTFTQGNVAGKPLTEQQSKDTVYATRAQGALPLVDKYETALTGWSGTSGRSLGQIPIVGNFLKTEDFQKAEQAGDEFTMAFLRKDTGAAITETERADVRRVYLPLPGDTAETLAQKRTSRLRALEAIKAGMPPQAIMAQELALRRSGQPQTAPAQPMQQQAMPSAAPQPPGGATPSGLQWRVVQ